MGDFRKNGSELSRISREGKHIRKQRIPLNYSSRIKGKSVEGSRSGNRDEGIIMESVLLRGYQLSVGVSKIMVFFKSLKISFKFTCTPSLIEVF